MVIPLLKKNFPRNSKRKENVSNKLSVNFDVSFICTAVRRMFEQYIRNLIAFKESNPGDEKEDESEEEEEEEKGAEGGDDKNDEEALIALLQKLFGSNIKDEEEKKEFFDSEEEFSQKVDKIAEWMKECNHVIMFTGAGISTR